MRRDGRTEGTVRVARGGCRCVARTSQPLGSLTPGMFTLSRRPSRGRLGYVANAGAVTGQQPVPGVRRRILSPSDAATMQLVNADLT